jgi:hypothetical protein
MCSTQELELWLANFVVIALCSFLHFGLCPGHNSKTIRGINKKLFRLTDLIDWKCSAKNSYSALPNFGIIALWIFSRYITLKRFTFLCPKPIREASPGSNRALVLFGDHIMAITCHIESSMIFAIWSHMRMFQNKTNYQSILLNPVLGAWAVTCTFQYRPWTGSIKPSVQYYHYLLFPFGMIIYFK